MSTQTPLSVKATTEAVAEEAVRSLVDRHLQLWNEHDQGKRNMLLNDIYAADIEMVDHHFTALGHQELDGFITGLQEKNPDFRFSPAKPVSFHHNIARLFWQAGNAAKPDAVKGMDFFVIADGKVQKLYVFVDEA